MKLNNIEVSILYSVELIDLYNRIIPDDIINDNVIYCIHNKINNKNYIGQAKNFRNRFSYTFIGHFSDYTKFIEGTLNEKRALYNAWRKYGLESFSVFIIETCDSRDSMNEREVYWISTLHTFTGDKECFGYNMTKGGEDPSWSITSPETIEKSIKTRIEKYGSPWANCHTPEAFEKGVKTKIERYGTAWFANAFTPEANEKRKQTNLRKFGTPYGPRVRKEVLKRMLRENAEKYNGDVMGQCNTPELRALARENRMITVMFNIINENLRCIKEITGKDVLTWKDYYNNIRNKFHKNYNRNRHIRRLLNILPLLKKDSNRWTDQMEMIFKEEEIISTIKSLKTRNHGKTV